MSRILLLGGTGAMGVYLVGALRALGHEVCVTSRRPRPDTEGVRYLLGNAHDLAFVQAAAQTRPDAVVDFMVYDTPTFRGRVSALLGLSGHYLFLSSYRVYAETVPLSETSPRLLEACHDAAYLRTDEYGLAKARQEDLLRAFGAGGGTYWTILRPGITFSRARFQLGTLEADTVCWRSFHGLPVALPREMLGRRTTLTWGKDAAAMIARLTLNPKAFGETFTVASAESHTWREVAALYGEAIGLRVREVPLEAYLRVMGGPYQVRYDRLFNRVIDNRKVLAATGLSQADLTPLAEALPRELAAFRAHPSYPHGVAGGNARQDRLLGMYCPRAAWSPAERRCYWRARWPWLWQNLAVRALRRGGRLLRGLFGR